MCFPSAIGVDKLAFGATNILSSFRADIHVGHSCRNSFQELRKSCQLWDLIFQPMILTLLPDLPKAWKMLCFPLTLRVDNHSFQNYFVKEKFLQLILWFQTSVLIAFAVSYTEPVEKTWTKTLQNLCCQTELPFIAVYDRETLKLSTDPCQILELPNHNLMFLPPLL